MKAQGRAGGRNERREKEARSYLHHQRDHVKLLLMSVIRLKAAVRALFVCHPLSTEHNSVRKRHKSSVKIVVRLTRQRDSVKHDIGSLDGITDQPTIHPVSQHETPSET